MYWRHSFSLANDVLRIMRRILGEELIRNRSDLQSDEKLNPLLAHIGKYYVLKGL